MKTIIDILIERDGISIEEAQERIDEVREMLEECDPFEADDILMDELGLEPDYIMELFL